ncbi:MAG: hypothetical protein M1837_007044 [Sclerophora amabilis]|nr:MAG: hypothetical protein M1837_007044 [Sclerophora amabilis]
MTTTSLDVSQANEFDYVIVGGGTAGCVVASRLSSYLPQKKVLLVEAGPSDFNDDRVLNLKEWLHLLGGELDYDYGTTEQPNGQSLSENPARAQRNTCPTQLALRNLPYATGPTQLALCSSAGEMYSMASNLSEMHSRGRIGLRNSHIRHSRAKVLGGCSSHNTLISFRPFELDCQRWEALGCHGWNFKLFTRLLDQLRNQVQPVHARHRNQLCKDWISSCSSALDVPIIPDFNAEIRSKGGLKEGTGFFSVAYNPDDGKRSSASVAYIHPILRGEEKRPNLTILTHAWVDKVNVLGDEVTGVSLALQNRAQLTITPKEETILCAGAVDTPRLLLHSGIGPRRQLEDLGIPVVKDVPGVGENLLDHPESIIMWELEKPVPSETTMDSDAGLFLRRELPNAHGRDGEYADIMMHCYSIPFCLNTSRLGYDAPINAFCMTPNIPRPRSKGRLYLTSADPSVKPALDFRYFTDPEGYDAATIVAGLRASRQVAEAEPFKSWLKREVAPGPAVQSDEALSEYGRKVAHTVYHPAGTTKMGDVVDHELRMNGLKRVRIADAGVFPVMPSINPMLTVLAIGERCAELLAHESVRVKARL